MLDKIRHSGPVEYVRRAIRDKAIRAVEEAVAGQTVQIERLLAELRDEVHRATDRLVEHTTRIEIRARRDLVAAADAEAALESAHFVRDNMRSARHFGDPIATLEHGLSLAPAGGMALEFGVFSGTTLNVIAKARGGEGVYGFDSFQGLPEDWRASFPAGTFRVDELPEIEGAELVVGWFDDTLPGFLASHPGPVDFLHIDADLYSSAVTVLRHVGPRLRAGSVIVFDEFFNYPGWREHEYRAWQEYVRAKGIEFRYEAYTYDHEQVVVCLITPEAPGDPGGDPAPVP